MNYAVLVYLISLLGDASIFFVLIGWVTLTGVFVYSFCRLVNLDTWKESTDGTIKFIILGICSIVISGLIPTKETSYMMVAAVLTQKAVDNPEVANVSNKLLNIVNNELDLIIRKQTHPVNPEESGKAIISNDLSCALNTVEKVLNVGK